MRAAAGLLLLLLPGCSRAVPPTTYGPVAMSSASPNAVLPIPLNSGRLIIDVREVENPDQAPVTITAVDDGSPPSEEKFTLYPPDQPARFAIRTARGATRLRLSLVPSNEPGASRLVVRVAVRPAEN